MKSKQIFLNQLNSGELELSEDELRLKLEEFDVWIEEITPSRLVDRSIALALCLKDGHNFQVLTSFHDDEDFVNEIVQHYPKAYKYASKRVKGLDYIVENICLGSPQHFELIPDKFKSDKNLVALTFENISSSSKLNAVWTSVLPPACNDKSFVEKILSHNKGIYQYLNENLRNDADIIKQTLTDYYQFKNLPDDKKEKLEYMEIACKTSGIPIKDFTANVLNNASIMLEFLKRFPGAIFWCGESIKNNEEIAFEVCGQKLNPHPYSFFSEEVRSNSEIAQKSVMANVLSGESLPYVLTTDKEFAKKMIENDFFDCKVLQWFDVSITNSLILMNKAIKKDVQALSYLGSYLKNDKEFINALLPITDKNMFNQLSIWKKTFAKLSYKPEEVKSLSIFLEKIQEYLSDKTYKEQSSAFKSLLNELPASYLKEQLIDGDSIANYNSILLKINLDSTLSGKAEKVKIKI